MEQKLRPFASILEGRGCGVQAEVLGKGKSRVTLCMPDHLNIGRRIAAMQHK
ncbi:hypothetical protein [Rhizobium paknamense]|uniref:Transposase n=1 Tax=Rhizobium paknamense TaxID=1206817 RepID=A0ABU0III8_9HYPH|nr:hypothetical protein [Rhizobium paknamense]MDQ0458037.1 hypothetical protein [Rhizobium paknamense]